IRGRNARVVFKRVRARRCEVENVEAGCQIFWRIIRNEDRWIASDDVSPKHVVHRCGDNSYAGYISGDNILFNNIVGNPTQKTDTKLGVGGQDKTIPTELIAQPPFAQAPEVESKPAARNGGSPVSHRHNPLDMIVRGAVQLDAGTAIRRCGDTS